jgi:Methyltransferase domain
VTDGAESAEDLSSGHGGARADHWDAVYGGSAEDAVSWFEPEPTVSLQLLDRVGAVPTDPIVDVGAGAARLVDALLDRAFSDVTVLDVSEVGLAQARRRLGERAQRVRWVVADLLSLQPPRRYRVWHDRAVFHFLPTRPIRPGTASSSTPRSRPAPRSWSWSWSRPSPPTAPAKPDV